MGSHGSAEGLGKSKGSFGFLGSRFWILALENFTLTVLDCPSVEVLNNFLMHFQQQTWEFPLKMSLWSHKKKFILDRYICVIVLTHHSSASVVTQWWKSSISRSLMSVTVPPGSDSWGKLSLMWASASHNTLLGMELFRSLSGTSSSPDLS